MDPNPQEERHLPSPINIDKVPVEVVRPTQTPESPLTEITSRTHMRNRSNSLPPVSARDMANPFLDDADVCKDTGRCLAYTRHTLVLSSAFDRPLFPISRCCLLETFKSCASQ